MLAEMLLLSLPSCKIIGLVDCLPCKGPDW